MRTTRINDKEAYLLASIRNLRTSLPDIQDADRVEHVKRNIEQMSQQLNDLYDRRGMCERVYLVVPYAERAQVSTLGAQLDKARGKWFVPPFKNLVPFRRWIKSHQSV